MMNQTKIKFWGGLNTIGGNIAEIRYGNDRVIFDFGQAYNPADVLLTNAKGRDDSRVADKLKLGILPKIDGIYSEKDLLGTNFNLETAEESKLNTAIFISHLHLDHIGSIDAIPGKIPFYMSVESKDLLEQLMIIGEPPFKEMDEIRTFNNEETIMVGDIKVTAIQIDHDTHGSVSLLIETPDKKICYSGDIRMHGQRPEINHAWMKKMNEQKLDMLLMEATSFSPNTDESEKKSHRDLYSEPEIPVVLEQKLNKAHGVVFFNFYHRNLDRLNHYINVSHQCGRILVLEAPTAQIAATFFPNASFKVLKQADATGWVTTLYEKYDQITVAEINENPVRYLVQNDFTNVLNLIDYKVDSSMYIHSNGMPLGAFDPAFNSLLSFLEKIGVQYETVATSGHADQEAVLDIIDKILPNNLVIWHSLAPETVVPRNENQKVLRPELDTWYNV